MTPISSFPKDSEQRKRCSIDDDIEEVGEPPPVVVSTVLGELFSKTVEALLFFEVITLELRVVSLSMIKKIGKQEKFAEKRR